MKKPRDDKRSLGALSTGMFVNVTHRWRSPVFRALQPQGYENQHPCKVLIAARRQTRPILRLNALVGVSGEQVMFDKFGRHHN